MKSTASPEWEHTAVFVLYDDSDGWYDHVMGPIVNPSSTPDDNLFGPHNCGTAPASAPSRVDAASDRDSRCW